MTFHRRLLIALAATIGIISSPLLTRAAAPDSPPAVFLSEVAWAGSSKSLADEWVEITNMSANAVSLGGWSIDGAGTSGAAITLPADASISPYSTYLIANYENGHANSTLAVTPQMVTTAVSLSNSKLRLVLRNNLGEQVDVAGDGGAPFAGGPRGTGAGALGGYAAMVRRSALLDGATSEAWGASEESIGFISGAMDAGTPGTREGWFVPPPPPTVTAVIPPAVEEPSVTTQITTVPVTEPVVKESPAPMVPADQPAVAVPTAADEPILPTAPITTIETVGATEPVTTPMPIPTADPVVAEPTPIATQTNDSVVTTAPATEPTNADSVTNAPVVTNAIPAVNPVLQTTFPPGTLVINELVSDPEAGQDEWIEIFNPYNNVIPLNGWNVRDASGKTTPLPAEPLGFEQFVVIVKPAGKLNNDGDTVELVDPSGNAVDAVRYGADAAPIAKKPNSLARDVSGAWMVTTTKTEGQQNLITAPVTTPSSTAEAVVPAANPTTATTISSTSITSSSTTYVTQPVEATTQTTSANSAVSTTQPAQGTQPASVSTHPPAPAIPEPVPAAPPGPATTVSASNNSVAPASTVPKTIVKKQNMKPVVHLVALSGIADFADKTFVKSEGTVVALPGAFGALIMYVADEGSVVQLFQGNGLFPGLVLGDRVSFTGMVSTVKGEKRVNIGKAKILSVIEHGAMPAAVAYAIPELKTTAFRGIVETEGVVLSHAGHVYTIEQDGEQIAVRLNTLANGTGLKSGMRVKVQGVLIFQTGSLTVYVDSPDHVDILAEPTTVAANGNARQTESHQQTAGIIAGASLIPLIGLAVRQVLPK